MTKTPSLPRVATGVKNLDAILHGGLPRGSVTVLSGPPGSGKTILAQQMCFSTAAADRRVLYFGTLSEPIAKTLRYLKQLAFFDEKALKQNLKFIDLGEIVRMRGLAGASELILGHVKKAKPAMIVIDSFKVFDDLAQSQEEIRKFSYEIVVNLMAWQTTALLIGEYAPEDYRTKPLFSIVDGLVVMSQHESSGEHQRFLQVVKLRGTEHSHEEHAFTISRDGIELFAPRFSMRRDGPERTSTKRCLTQIAKLDALLGSGIPWGSSLLVSGVAGTGKTVLSLEFIYRGALAGEPGIFFSFEETEERLRATARGLGWDLETQIKRGMVQIVFIPQPDILVESHILMMSERVAAMNAKRVVIDSVSVFLHKQKDAQVMRERVFHLCSIVQNAHAVGLFTTDVPYGQDRISRFGVEETVVDGVVILSAVEEGLDRRRYLEVYKLRNTAHLKGRHSMLIENGITVFPRYETDAIIEAEAGAAALGTTRVATGVPGLDAILGGGVLSRSVTLVSGSAGIGKSTIGAQFLLAGADDPGLYVSLEEGPAQLMTSADAIGLPLRAAVEAGRVEILHASNEHLRAGEFLSALVDRIAKLGARRVVLDAASFLVGERPAFYELRTSLTHLAARFRAMGVTSLITLEAHSLTEHESVTELALSAIADNILMLRYHQAGERLVRTLTVVKTRGSAHDSRRRTFTNGPGGVRVAAEARGRPQRKKAERA